MNLPENFVLNFFGEEVEPTIHSNDDSALEHALGYPGYTGSLTVERKADGTIHASWSDLVEDYEEEMSWDEAHARAMASPALTGRI